MKRGLILIIFLLSVFSVLADSQFIDFAPIPTLNLTTGPNNNVINLDDYYNGTDLSYKFKPGSKGLSGIQVNIDRKGSVDITANNPGEYSIIFIADNDTDDKESNDVKLKVEGESVIIKALDFFPPSDSVSIVVGEKKNFAVSGENVSAEWYLDKAKLPETTGTFAYDPALAGNYTLEVVVGEERKTWSVIVEAVEVVEPVNIPPVEPIAQCGNNIKEKNENCENCPEDVKCTKGSSCKNAVCVKDTGISSILIWIGILGIIIIALVIGVIFAKGSGYLDNLSFDFLTNVFSKLKKERKKEIKETPIEEVEEDLSPLKQYLFDNLKKGYNKQDLIKASLQQGWKQEQIDKVLSIREDLKPLLDYLESNLKKGYNKQDLIKASLQQGWKQEDIDEVLTKIGRK